MKGKDISVYTQCCRVCNGTGLERLPCNTNLDGSEGLKYNSKCVKPKMVDINALKVSDVIMRNHPLVQRLQGVTSLGGNGINKDVERNSVLTPLGNDMLSAGNQIHDSNLVAVPSHGPGCCSCQSGGCSNSHVNMRPIHNTQIVRRHHSQARHIGGKSSCQPSCVNVEGRCPTMPNSSRMMLMAREAIDSRLVPVNNVALEHNCCSQGACGNLSTAFSKVFRPQEEYEHDFDSVFTSYISDDCDFGHIDEDVCDISDTNFDFRTLSGFSVEDESFDPATVSIIDMICGTPDIPEESTTQQSMVLESSSSNDLTPELVEYPLYIQPAPTTRKGRAPKKGKGSRVRKEFGTSASHRNSAAIDNNLVKVPNNVDDPSTGDGPVEWYPGFSRQLGAKGRSAILDLVRRVYRQDPNHYKAILQARNPPSSISNLPFFNIPMLWELAHQFGVFQQAIQVHKNQQNASVKGDRSKSKSKAERAERHADFVAPVPEPVVQLKKHVEDEIQSNIHTDVVEVAPAPQPFTPVQSSKRANVPIPEVEHGHVNKYQKLRTESANATDLSRPGFTSFSGRSIKPCKRYVDYQEDYRKPVSELSAMSCESDTTQGFDQSQLEPASPSLSPSSITDMNKNMENLPEGVAGPNQVQPLSLLWHVTQRLAQKDIKSDTLVERISQVSSERSTPTRCISV
ncbi:hypothetical protein X943_001901 [Babesia divergens]|uniref:Uncharacterized protein n=1 Tax=Babesia divergens TaxID=32595 RepID=A0AAD9G731_BABDI|nr:hypothetical protein X943_001901 [Babesia divergens]